MNFEEGGLSSNSDRRMVVKSGTINRYFLHRGGNCPRPSADPNMRVERLLNGTDIADTVNKSLGSCSKGTARSPLEPFMPLTLRPSCPDQNANSSQDNGEDYGPRDRVRY